MSNFLITPYCIYHSASYKSTVRKADLYKEDNNIKFKCEKSYIDDFWTLSGIFYAIDPNLRPLISGTSIFCMKISKSFPYNIIDVKAVYDPYRIETDCIYFIAYTKKTINTIPLYLHTAAHDIYLSFDKSIPQNGVNWKHDKLSPIFIMTPETVGYIYDHIKFKCINGRCLPWSAQNEEIFNFNNYDKLMSLKTCILECNVTKGENTNNIINKIYNKSKKKNIPVHVLVILLLIVFVIIIIYIVKINGKMAE